MAAARMSPIVQVIAAGAIAVQLQTDLVPTGVAIMTDTTIASAVVLPDYSSLSFVEDHLGYSLNFGEDRQD